MSRPYVVMDTEYTTWEGSRERRWQGPGERREIIQIAAIRFDENHVEQDRFLRYVKPVFNPILSDLFVELTGIQQQTVDEQGVPFTTAAAEFLKFAQGYDNWCYGRDDAIMKENASWFDADFHMPLFLDARTLVAAVGEDPAYWSSGSVHQIVGAPRPGSREHDALDDCMSLALFMKDIRVLVPNGFIPKRQAV